ncbi:hypothetical protein LTS08_008251 [Lithohypha guttulata]|nr:hypothetical protein LTS08_008251 [Lithohypha guttulata]
MFVTTRDAGVRRRNRVYSNNKTARSSKVSLLTISTTGSGGSNSTITQESYDRSHRTKKRRSRDQRSRRQNDEGVGSGDVFDFLVDDKSKSQESLSEMKDGKSPAPIEGNDSDSIQDEAVSNNPGIVVHLDEAEAETEPEPEGYYRSMSDSGISMGSCSSITGLTPHLPVLHEELPSRHQSEPLQGNEIAMIDPRWTWSTSSPQPYPDGFIPPPCPPPPPAVVYDVPMYQPYPYPPYTPPYATPPRVTEDEKRGPYINIREPAGQVSKPTCFRSFSKLSTRLLLQMQDDIADLEEELRDLDTEVDTTEQSFDHDSSSSSSQDQRREKKNRETEIYQELHAQLDQYYHALEMMQKVEDISKPAVTSDLTKYYQWLEDRITDSSNTRRLVGNDLRKFSTLKEREVQSTQCIQPYSLAYTALVNAVIPLIIFKGIKGVLNRLIVLLLFVVVGAVVQERMHKKFGREELKQQQCSVSASRFIDCTTAWLGLRLSMLDYWWLLVVKEEQIMGYQ